MRTWDERMVGARIQARELIAQRPIDRIVAYNSQGSFLDNMALMVALDEMRRQSAGDPT